MISARLFVFSVFCFAIALVLSTPTPDGVTLYKRSDSTAVLSILQTLQGDVSKVLPQLGKLHLYFCYDNDVDAPRCTDSVVVSGKVTDASIRPLISSLVDAAVAAVKSTSGLTLPITFVSGATQGDLVALAVQIASVYEM
jgi:hypothetical protein